MLYRIAGFIGFIALWLAVYISLAQAAGPAREQVCQGILKVDEYNEYSLENAKGKLSNGKESLWCDATITGDDFISKVLKVCSLDRPCRIRGYFIGHGVFYWTRINKVIKPPYIEDETRMGVDEKRTKSGKVK